MLVVLYGCKHIRASSGRSKYFNVMRMRRIFKQHFESRDKFNYDKDDNPYIVAYKTNRKYFKLEKYLADYFADEQFVNMVIITLKKGVALQTYDSR